MKRQLLLLLLLILRLLSHPLGIMFYLTKSLRVRRNIEKEMPANSQEMRSLAAYMFVTLFAIQLDLCYT